MSDQETCHEKTVRLAPRQRVPRWRIIGAPSLWLKGSDDEWQLACHHDRWYHPVDAFVRRYVP